MTEYKEAIVVSSLVEASEERFASVLRRLLEEIAAPHFQDRSLVNRKDEKKSLTTRR